LTGQGTKKAILDLFRGGTSTKRTTGLERSLSSNCSEWLSITVTSKKTGVRLLSRQGFQGTIHEGPLSVYRKLSLGRERRKK